MQWMSIGVFDIERILNVQYLVKFVENLLGYWYVDAWLCYYTQLFRLLKPFFVDTFVNLFVKMIHINLTK